MGYTLPARMEDTSGGAHSPGTKDKEMDDSRNADENLEYYLDTYQNGQNAFYLKVKWPAGVQTEYLYK